MANCDTAPISGADGDVFKLAALAIAGLAEMAWRLGTLVWQYTRPRDRKPQIIGRTRQSLCFEKVVMADRPRESRSGKRIEGKRYRDCHSMRPRQNPP